MAPILIGLLIGVAIGSYILSLVHPAWVKFVTYFMLLPLILLQAAGIRKPIQAEKAIAIPFGVGIGTLYSITIISGPPLALLFNNQGVCQTGFPGRAWRHSRGRSGLHGNRLLFHWTLQRRQHVDHYIVPSVLLGIPLGSYLIRWKDPETFRRICMAFDALVVAFGLSRVLIDLNLATAFTTYSILTIMMMLNAYLLFRFIRDWTVP